MYMRKTSLVIDEIYHVYSKSIADFKIFRSDQEYERMKSLFKYYRHRNPLIKYSAYLELSDKKCFFQKHLAQKNKLVDIIAYCIMPTHIHVVLKQLEHDGISIFMGNILNSYSRYFNIKTKRRGPLWESRFKRILIETDECMHHITRYIHLNPVTDYLVNRPQDWAFSSHREFLGLIKDQEKICDFSGIFNMTPKEYEEFTNSQIDYQRQLAKEKKQIFT